MKIVTLLFPSTTPSYPHYYLEKPETQGKLKKLKVEDLEIRNTLGTGSFGRVHLVKYKPTGKHYAMKVLKKNEIIKLRQVEHTMNEKQILEQLDFPFLVKILGTFQDSNNLYLVLEYVQGGELFTYLRKSGVSFIFHLFSAVFGPVLIFALPSFTPSDFLIMSLDTTPLKLY